jgi:hypothetical protein
LLARTLAYSMQPSPAANVLEQRAGGPAFPTLVLATLALGAALAVCWLAALGVRERALLELPQSSQPPHRDDPDTSIGTLQGFDTPQG